MTTPHALPDPGPGAPTPPIELAGGAAGATARLDAERVGVDDGLLTRLRGACAEVTTDAAVVAEASRDWWPLAMAWATAGQVAGLAAAVARPTDAGQVAAVLALCNEVGVPVTAAGGRSGVCGASVPLHGGVVLDLTALAGIVDVDATSLVLDVLPGTFGDLLERDLRTDHGATLGHWPQSVALSTVGGWLACRSAGQLSGRYGKIEDMVLGLDVALADGRRITTGGWPRGAVGPDLTQLFVGSEGTLGVITAARLRLHPAPTHERRCAWLLPSFDSGLDTMRRIVQRGATPAVMRLYDAVEADRTYGTGDRALLLVLDEGDGALVAATVEMVAEECELRGQGTRADADHVEHWLAHRNEVAALEALTSRGYTVDTMEVSASWFVVGAARAVPGHARRPHGGRGHDRRVGPPVAQLPHRRLPLLHVRGAGRRRRARRLLPRAVGRRAAGRPRERRGAQPSPRRRAEPGPLHGRGGGPGPRRARRRQERARPERHPQPRQAGTAVAVGAGGRLVSGMGQTASP
jgi:alkyldihydroxyacetonephosphate synthase